MRKFRRNYLDGNGSYHYLAAKYGIGSKTLRQWVAKYRIYGIASFITKPGNASYSSEFKTMCVKAVLSGEGSVDDIVAKYNISSRQVLRGCICGIAFCFNSGNVRSAQYCIAIILSKEKQGTDLGTLDEENRKYIIVQSTFLTKTVKKGAFFILFSNKTILK